MEKYWFDSCLAVRLGTDDVKELVFDEMIDDSRKKQVMINLFYEDNYTAGELASKMLLNNPYPETTDTLPTILGLLRELCSELGLCSTHDFEGSFTSTIIDEKLVRLQPIVKDLIEIIHLPRSTAKKPRVNFLTCLNSILKAFSGSTIKDIRRRNRITGSNKKEDTYTYFLETQDAFVKNVLLLVTPAS